MIIDPHTNNVVPVTGLRGYDFDPNVPIPTIDSRMMRDNNSAYKICQSESMILNPIYWHESSDIDWNMTVILLCDGYNTGPKPRASELPDVPPR